MLLPVIWNLFTNRKEFTQMSQDLLTLWQNWSSSALTPETLSILCLLMFATCSAIIITFLCLTLTKLRVYLIALIRLACVLLKKLRSAHLSKLPEKQQLRAQKQVDRALKVLESAQEVLNNGERLFSVCSKSDRHDDTSN